MVWKNYPDPGSALCDTVPGVWKCAGKMTWLNRNKSGIQWSLNGISYLCCYQYLYYHVLLITYQSVLFYLIVWTVRLSGILQMQHLFSFLVIHKRLMQFKTQSWLEKIHLFCHSAYDLPTPLLMVSPHWQPLLQV